MNKLCRTYIRKVKLLFPVMGKYERKYIKAITINVNDYLADVPESTIDDLYKEFGTPKDIIDSYYSTVNTDDVIKKIRISKYIKLILTICLLSLTIMKIYIQYEGHKVFMEEQIHSEETIIE